MYIVTNEKPAGTGQVLCSYLPPNIRSLLIQLDFSQVEEIRLRLGMPLCIGLQDASWFLCRNGQLSKDPKTAYIVSREDIDAGVELISRGSLYSLENEIRQGYITVTGGHRVGIAGRAVVSGLQITSLKEISGLNYRFAKEITGAADALIHIICKNAMPLNTLILSPPQCGKTTMLRDLARQMSHRGYKVCVVDERCEIAGMHLGESPYDLGPQTDVLDACPKAEGMLMALRSLSPQVIITDEIGNSKDFDAIHSALSCGVCVIASIHAASRVDLLEKTRFQRLKGLFECFVTLSKRRGSGTVEEIYTPPQKSNRI